MTHHTISRISVTILGVVMIIFGLYHFMKPQNLLVYVPDFIPGGIIWVYIVGAAFILAGIAFILHKMVELAGYLLALLLIIFVLSIHFPNYLNAGDADMKQMAFVNLLKDTALAAFAMYIGSNARNFE
ncbi:hypothetical protein [Segetibacter koreensis]|uniref:hypothetical protein n=1 Tax=Segetibacter koreensis TaxID=398037 RepID=UPI000382570D|nr:hypothetical protein [Segetibacter koreensis]